MRTVKWIFDRLAAACLLVVAAPLLIVIAVLVRVVDGAPVLHRETRLGRGGKPFTLFKFRSMTTTEGPGIAPVGDPRITRLGAWLRRSRLDELPQFLNILSGDMSFVGPRPMQPAHADRLAPDDRDTLLSVRPGITGASALAFIGDDAALCGRADAEAAYVERVLPEKVALEIDYVRRWSLSADARLLTRTLTRLWSRDARQCSRERVDELLHKR